LIIEAHMFHGADHGVMLDGAKALEKSSFSSTIGRLEAWH